MTLLSFHDDPAIKETYLQRVRAHAAADEIVQGQYWANGKGCAVGCTIHGRDRGRYETELGIPAALAHLQDRIFERLPPAEARTFPEEFLEAIPIGVDLVPAIRRFHLFVRHGNLARVEGLSLDEALKAQVVDAIRGVIALYEAAEPAAVSAEAAAWSASRATAWSVETTAWSAARTAEAAAWSAAWSAARSAARSAAWSALESAARSAESAVLSVSEPEASAAAAATSMWRGFRAELIRLLRAAG